MINFKFSKCALSILWRDDNKIIFILYSLCFIKIILHIYIFVKFHSFLDEPNYKESDNEEDVAEDLDFLQEQGDDVDLPLVPGCS